MTTPVAEPVRSSPPAAASEATPGRARAAYTSVAAGGLVLLSAAAWFMFVIGMFSGLDIVEGGFTHTFTVPEFDTAGMASRLIVR
jgi:hypothetical protein